MALTQSARHPGAPSWDDQVVPALRKRLEGESRILSNRISAALSVSSLEDPEATYQPRPSYTTSSDRPNPPRLSNSSGAPRARTRTFSTPKLSEIPTKARTRTPDIAQYSEPRPTRIPKASRGRSGSISGNGHTSPSPYNSPRADTNDGLLVPAKILNKPSQDTIHIPMRQTSGLLNEPAPFMPGPESTNSHDETPPRPSNDSEERPFEHWYRGEVSRNGGVGEAQIGEAPGDKQALAASRDAEPSTPRLRKRSDSVAGIEVRHRESLYLDEDHANNVGRVLDEGPLTDVDAEMSDSDYYYQQQQQQYTPSPQDRRYQTPTPTQQRAPSRQQDMHNATPQPMQRGISEPPTFPAIPKRSATASPPAGSSSAAKKPRAASATRAKPKPKPKPAASDKDRRSVAYYPSPGDDEDMADAIPSWTQPIAPPTGRWDDVVLPVVARKKGLDGLYEQADGSPKPKKLEDPVAPAPGTFGWDHSKYRPPREGDMQMDEFGRPVEMIAEGEEEGGMFGTPLYPPTEHERQPVGPQTKGLPPSRPQPPPSPAPFAQYANKPEAPVINIDLEAAKMMYGANPPPPADEDGDAGCCKCVVM
ncbi:hypothetical protein FB45DRAFT_1115754 [Roridomyces roridus]|uniref:Uncharacterized protein n=1 Tax=Roridomyces roridus TaxID=1738132 RepID=A0AAD7FUV5_9AGAR|nr:hypothetical protein FB45DRAFT_1115754 [Roridomyces roridus]